MAVTITAAGMAEVLGVSQALADRLHPVATALVERFAPDAPEEIQNEAAIRFAGYLATAKNTGVRKIDIGGIGMEPITAHGPAFRNCGAMALLSPWKVRRAGVI